MKIRHSKCLGHGIWEKELCVGKDSSNGACSHGARDTNNLMVRFQPCLGFKCWLCFCAGQEL